MKVNLLIKMRLPQLYVFVFGLVKQYYKIRNSSVIAIFVDCSKAFDRILQSKLFDILSDKGVC